MVLKKVLHEFRSSLKKKKIKDQCKFRRETLWIRKFVKYVDVRMIEDLRNIISEDVHSFFIHTKNAILLHKNMKWFLKDVIKETKHKHSLSN